MGFINSVRNAIIGTLGTLFICSMAGYGFQIYRNKAKDRLMSILLLSMMIPFAAVMVPLFRLTASFKLLNTTAGIILPGLSTAFMIFFFRQCAQSFPMEIVQSARVDGLGEFGIFIQIFMPVMSPTYAAAAIVTFMTGWNNFLWPYISITEPRNMTAPIGLPFFRSQFNSDIGYPMAANTVASVPILIAFFCFQKYIIKGIAFTGIKG